jgi:hypothetical protein
MSQPSAEPLLLLHEFHPPEDLRRFACAPASVIRADEAVVVVEAAEGDRLIRHHMWADRWFTITTTIDLVGRFIEGGGPKTIPFAFDCDISTPFIRIGDSVYTVDMWLDVLVRADGTTYQVVDRDHFARAQAAGWLSEAEASGALRGLEDLTGIIERAELIEMLAAIHPFGPAERPAPDLLPRADPSDYPLLLPGIRSTW